MGAGFRSRVSHENVIALAPSSIFTGEPRSRRGSTRRCTIFEPATAATRITPLSPERTRLTRYFWSTAPPAIVKITPDLSRIARRPRQNRMSRDPRSPTARKEENGDRTTGVASVMFTISRFASRRRPAISIRGEVHRAPSMRKRSWQVHSSEADNDARRRARRREN